MSRAQPKHWTNPKNVDGPLRSQEFGIGDHTPSWTVYDTGSAWLKVQAHTAGQHLSIDAGEYNATKNHKKEVMMSLDRDQALALRDFLLDIFPK